MVKRIERVVFWVFLGGMLFVVFGQYSACLNYIEPKLQVAAFCLFLLVDVVAVRFIASFFKQNNIT